MSGRARGLHPEFRCLLGHDRLLLVPPRLAAMEGQQWEGGGLGVRILVRLLELYVRLNGGEERVLQALVGKDEVGAALLRKHGLKGRRSHLVLMRLPALPRWALGRNGADQRGPLLALLSQDAPNLVREDGAKRETHEHVRLAARQHAPELLGELRDELGDVLAVVLAHPNAAPREHDLVHLVAGQLGRPCDRLEDTALAATITRPPKQHQTARRRRHGLHAADPLAGS